MPRAPARKPAPPRAGAVLHAAADASLLDAMRPALGVAVREGVVKGWVEVPAEEGLAPLDLCSAVVAVATPRLMRQPWLRGPEGARLVARHDARDLSLVAWEAEPSPWPAAWGKVRLAYEERGPFDDPGPDPQALASALRPPAPRPRLPPPAEPPVLLWPAAGAGDWAKAGGMDVSGSADAGTVHRVLQAMESAPEAILAAASPAARPGAAAAAAAIARRGSFDVVAWLRGEPLLFDEDLAELGARLDVPHAGLADRRAAARAAARWLSEVRLRWLLVVDAPQPGLPAPPRSSQGRVLWLGETARPNPQSAVPASVAAAALPRQDSAAILGARQGSGLLAHVLGDLPGPLRLAARLLERGEEAAGLAIRLGRPESPSAAADVLVAAALSRLPADAVHGLRACAWLADEPLAAAWCPHAATWLEAGLAEAHPTGLAGPVVPAWVQDTLRRTDPNASASLRAALGLACASWPEGARPNPALVNAILPHALAAAGHANRLGWLQPPAGRLLNLLAIEATARGRPELARRWLEAAVRGDEALLGKDHPDVARDLNNLATVMQELGDPGGAHTRHKWVLAIDEAKAGAGPGSDVATDLNNLGTSLQAMGDPRAALRHHERALAIDEQVRGPGHPDVATDLNNLGAARQALGEHAVAVPLHRRALAIDEAALGKDHPDVATDLGNLASALQGTGQAKEAKPLMERALAIDEAAFGTVHQRVARDLAGLGAVLRELGDLAAARAHHERALRIHREVHGEGHPETALARAELAQVMAAQGDRAGARREGQAAVDALRRHQPPAPADLADALALMARLEAMDGRPLQASRLLEEAVALDESRGLRGPKLASRLGELGEALAAAGKLQRARLVEERALRLAEESHGEAHPQAARAHRRLANLLLAMGDVSLARRHAERALRIHESSLGSGHPEVGDDLAVLAHALQAARDPMAAVPLLRRAVQVSTRAGAARAVALRLNDLGLALADAGDLPGAVKALLQADEAARSALGASHPDAKRIAANRGRLAGLPGAKKQPTQKQRPAGRGGQP